MKESEALQKRCCGPSPGLTGIYTSSWGKGAFYACAGSACMAWVSKYENEVKYIGTEEDVPEGWEIIGHIPACTQFSAQQRIVRTIKTDCGDCGLKSKESGRFYPS